MRTGANTIQQTLTPEAASVLKHSLTLARRRGHAQVTPLHVAATLLTSSRSNLFRRACIKSQPFGVINRQNHSSSFSSSSHPSLSCRALELCFNVALNRLPTNPSPLFYSHPSLSNALIAALKRAQANQRRGCVEQQQQQQQQPFLAVKVEVEQLVVSILDDPSVSRVMREAGFSSTAVKNNIEDDCSVVSPVFYGVGVFSSPCSPSSSENPSSFLRTHLLNHSHVQNPVLSFPQRRIFNIDSGLSLKEDVKLVVDILSRKNKKKSTVVVGDSLSLTEAIVAEVMDKIERGDVPDDLKQTHFIKFQFSPVGLKFMKRDDVDTHVDELKKKVDSFTSCGEGVILYIGDLNWTVHETNSVSSCYSAVNHLVHEIGRLVTECNNTSSKKVWVLGTASYQTYMRCQMRQPPLDVQWAFEAVSVPSGGLGLGLHATSTNDSRMNFSQNSSSQVLETKQFSGKEEEDELNCCGECTCDYKKEAQALKSGQQKLLPPWLQPHGDKANQKGELVHLRRKWNRFCHSLHQGRISNTQSLLGKGNSYSPPCIWWPSQSSVLPESSSASISFADSNVKQSHHISTSVAKFRRHSSCTIEFHFGNESHKDPNGDTKLEAFNDSEGKETKITLSLGNYAFTSSLGKSDEEKFEGLMDLSNLSQTLHENVPWQSETLPSIVKVLMDSMSRKKDTWIVISGSDKRGKRRLARVVAESLFGSVDSLLHMNMRKRRSQANTYSQMLTSALRGQQNHVFLVEAVDLAESQFMKLLADGFETKKFKELDRRGDKNGEAVFIFTQDDPRSDKDEMQCQDFIIKMELKFDKADFSTKRKAEFDIPEKAKNPRTDEKKNASAVACEVSNSTKDFSRQSSFNSTIDLNLKANEDDEEEEVKPRNVSPISKGFPGLIQNHFVFNRSQAQDREMRDAFLTKMKNSAQEILQGRENVSFSVEERVVEEICVGSGCFLNSLFDKWLKDVLQTALETVKSGGKEQAMVVIKLCFGGIADKVYEEDGYMGTCLPKNLTTFFSM